ncbi:MAG: EF-P lysine aminoacylase EpmA [Deltaproteobacteria bacterium]|nr:EF-P lysine aminoacylase EpmA [Deltaproteobacteria bacterium]
MVIKGGKNAPQVGRVVALNRDIPPCRISLYSQGRLHTLEWAGELPETLAEGSLVAFELTPSGDMKHFRILTAAPPRPLETLDDALRWQSASPGEALPRMSFLRLRHAVTRALRDYFDSQGFLEVDTPALVRAPSPEAVFEPISVGREAYLITSPEFQLKRMLVGGFERIYRLGAAFRGGEIGPLHNPEFTLLEWYHCLAGTEALAEDLARLLQALAPLAEQAADLWHAQSGARGEVSLRLRRLGEACHRPAIPVVTVRNLCADTLGVDLRGITQAKDLRRALLAAGYAGEAREDWDFTALFSALWLRVEQRMPPEPLLISEWPAPLASLARLKPDDPSVAERIELYAGGLELANGFAELTDPFEQRRRFHADLEQRRSSGLPSVPLDECFLSALEEGMPPAAGMALGVDRLVMLLTGAPQLRHVLPFAWDER